MRSSMADTFGSFSDNILPPLRNWIVALLYLTIRIGCSGVFVGTISGAFFIKVAASSVGSDFLIAGL